MLRAGSRFLTDSILPERRSRPIEALSMWLAGAGWSVVCLAVLRLDRPWLLPAALVGGLAMFVLWKRALQIEWFPFALVAGLMAEPLAAEAGFRHHGSAGYVELAVAAFVMVFIVRGLIGGVHGLPPILFRRPGRLVLLATFASLGPAVAAENAHDVLGRLPLVFAGLFAGAHLGTRAGRAPRVWEAFLILAGALGAAAVLATGFGGLAALAALASRLVIAWGEPGALFRTLLFVTAVVTGRMFDPDRSPWRRVSTIAVVAIAWTGLLLAASLEQGALAGAIVRPAGWERLWLSAALVAVPVGWNLELARLRPEHRGAHLGLAVALLLLVLIAPFGRPLAGRVEYLLIVLTSGFALAALDDVRDRTLRRIPAIVPGADCAMALRETA